MTSMEARERAAELLEAEGWIQGQDSTSSGRCLVKAILATTGNDELSTVVCAELRRELGESYLTTWQDRPRRTKEEVLALLRGARQ